MTHLSTAHRAETPSLARRYEQVRSFSERICAPLLPEDYVAQSMPEVSPTKWHLAHTTWFLETFILADARGYRPFHPEFRYLFNSYYNTVGAQFPRANRGCLSRPGVDEIHAYRRHVDAHMRALLSDGVSRKSADIVEIGLNHEQQHQELMLTDIKHVLGANPLRPAYAEAVDPVDEEDAGDAGEIGRLRWASYAENVREIGAGPDGFAWDNEQPRHRALIHGFDIATRLVTNGEYLEFMRDGGYSAANLWLSEGWDALRREGWAAPLYWFQGEDGVWREYTLRGVEPLRANAPVCHVSYFEADAFARWRGARLPTEFEWELAAGDADAASNLADDWRLRPMPAPDHDGSTCHQMLGDVWEWTASPYTAYPGYVAPSGAFGEYNGKFMCNQFVLRGGSFATPRDHIRITYRNFWPPATRWQFAGIRLAR
ncbi:MAG: ergothioneine biosynthesis protein EgtB [Phycisphaerales bacterium]|nr:ergothioneine biosynthesis protein EgtB [Phycisphaerales bacterium]